MTLRFIGVVLALCCASTARAQPTLEAPPVPPETESALRGRAAPAAESGKASAPAAAGGATVAPTPPPGGAPPAAGDPLRSFPPAPPPTEPGPPEQPTTALTSFAPAPAPTTGGAVATELPEPSEPAAAISSTEEPAPYVPREALWSAAALVGVGVTFDNTVAGVNPLGFGFGVRGDYRIAPEWSLGARMLYFVGGSVELPTSDVAMQTWLIAAEAAYVIETADHILIQPGLALGLHVRETDYRGFGGLTGSPEILLPPGTVRFGLYVAPGVNLAVPLALATPSLEPLIVGADVRLDMAFGKGVTSNVQLLVLAGFQF